MEIKECPYCGSADIEFVGDEAIGGSYYHCNSCDRLFNEDDCEYEEYWHRISLLLDENDEHNPLVFKKEYVVLPSVDEEAFGISELEKPNVEMVCQMKGEGTMWYHIEGYYDGFGENRVPIWEDMSMLDKRDIKAMLGHIIDEKVYQNIG